MEKMYMVRAGEKSFLYPQFFENNIVAVGWKKLGNLESIKTEVGLKELMIDKYPEYKKGTLGINVGQVKKFLIDMKINDFIITYNSEERIYSIGTVVSDYFFNDKLEYSNMRKVEWKGNISRDILSTAAKNTLGGISTIFRIPAEIQKEILSKINKDDITQTNISKEDEVEEVSILLKEVEEKAYEFIKDKIMDLNWEEMQNLVAALIRSLGFKTIVSKKGPDKGKDITASPDGLGLIEPRIIVEVKHRVGQQMGRNEVGSFISILREGNKGIYVSTGGFSKEAKYEAERANYPLTLVDIDELVNLIITNYDNFDLDGKAIIPLKKLYWPF